MVAGYGLSLTTGLPTSAELEQPAPPGCISAHRRHGESDIGTVHPLGYAARVRLAYHMMSSPLGLMFLARSERGLRFVEFMDRKSLKRMIASHASELPDARWEPSLLELKRVVEQFDLYFNGRLHRFELPLDPVGSEFQLRVWKALIEIPFGETRAYGKIGAAIGQPRAARAVGLANNQNPIAIVVPCHRVIGANGSLTGYGGGIHRKRWLLAHEAKHAQRSNAPLDLFATAGGESSRR